MNCFDGDFDLLPLRSHFDNGPVPYAPTESDFHLAVSKLRGAEQEAEEKHGGTITWRVAAARWFVEAIRARRAQPGAHLTTRELCQSVAAKLITWSQNAA
jgi:hypothetical protein